jgi:hypothetical protein
MVSPWRLNNMADSLKTIGGKSGREIVILENGKDVLADWKDCAFMELEESLNLSIVSNFDRQPFDGASSKAQDLSSLISIFGAATGNSGVARTTLKTAMMSASVWSGSNPISFQLNCTFHVGMKGVFDPKRQVYDPIMHLSELPLPWTEGAFLKAPGLVEGDVVLKAAAEIVAGLGIMKDGTKIVSTIYSVSVGEFFYLPWVIFERAEPVFNKQMAKSPVDGLLYPISGTINFGLRTVKAGTREMLRNNRQSYLKESGADPRSY